jgi:hypothetical protein
MAESKKNLLEKNLSDFRNCWLNTAEFSRNEPRENHAVAVPDKFRPQKLSLGEADGKSPCFCVDGESCFRHKNRVGGFVSKRILAELEREAEEKLHGAGISSVTVHISVENGASQIRLGGGNDEDRKRAAEILGFDLQPQHVL